MILQTKLLEPPGFSTSLRSNFVMMFREEWRQNVDFAKKRHIMMFPVMLALVSMVVTVGLRFLTGDAGIESAYDTMKAADAQSAKAFTWDELKVGLHLSLFMFSLGDGLIRICGPKHGQPTSQWQVIPSRQSCFASAGIACFTSLTTSRKWRFTCV